MWGILAIFFSANHESSENESALVFGTGKGSAEAQGPSPEALVTGLGGLIA